MQHTAKPTTPTIALWGHTYNMEKIKELLAYYLKLHEQLAKQLKKEGETTLAANGVSLKQHPAAAIRKGAADTIIKLKALLMKHEDQQAMQEIEDEISKVLGGRK